jgi:hypothetical protein
MAHIRENDVGLWKEKGILTSDEQELLYEMAEQVSHQCVVVEIANKTYESTDALVKGASSGGIRIFNLALHGKNLSTGKVGKSSSNGGLQGGISNPEIKNGVTIFKESAYGLSPYWKETIGLLLVIGYQQYEEIREAWQGSLSPNIVVVIHSCHEPGPARAIKEFLNDGGNFVLFREVNNMTALVMDNCKHYWAINSNEIGICGNCGRKRNFGRLNRETTRLGTRKRT